MVVQEQSVEVEVGARLAERLELGIQRREGLGRLRVVFPPVRAAIVPAEDGFGVPDERLPLAAVVGYRLLEHTYPADVETSWPTSRRTVVEERRREVAAVQSRPEAS